MPGRKVVLVKDQIYHIVNRGVGNQPIFLSKRDYHRALHTILYYHNNNPPLRYSFYIRSPVERQLELLNQFEAIGDRLVDIYAYCFMPNHIHLLLKQLKENGISKYMANYSNSYTKYFNAKYDRMGHLFQGKFKAVRIESDEQLMHVTRYIHLNPYSAYLVKSIEKLENYQYSSWAEYQNLDSKGYCNKSLIKLYFKTSEKYIKFVYDHADYQRKLEYIKHLTLE